MQRVSWKEKHNQVETEKSKVREVGVATFFQARPRLEGTPSGQLQSFVQLIK